MAPLWRRARLVPIGVVFSPKAIGTFHAQITITDNSGGVSNATQVVSLTGTATTVAPLASVTPAAIAFGDIVAGTASGAQQVTVANTGSAALSMTGIAISGANAADFAIVSSGANQCPTSGGSTGCRSKLHDKCPIFTARVRSCGRQRRSLEHFG